MNQTNLCQVLLLLALSVSSINPAQAQANDAFAKALANDSTSPRYVLITIINDKTGTQQTIYTLATFFDGAIHSQYHLPYTTERERKSREIALASRDRTYHCSQPNALQNLWVHYTPQILQQIH